MLLSLLLGNVYDNGNGNDNDNDNNNNEQVQRQRVLNSKVDLVESWNAPNMYMGRIFRTKKQFKEKP